MIILCRVAKCHAAQNSLIRLFMSRSFNFRPAHTSGFLTIPLFLALCFAFSCSQLAEKPKSAVRPQPDSHKKMLSILAEVKQKIYSPLNNFCAEAKLASLEEKLAAAQNPQQQMPLLFDKAMALLEYGDEAQAVQIYEQLYASAEGMPDARKAVRQLLGLAYIRLGERSNCLNHHSSDACIMPIRGNGVYQETAPTRKAIETFEAVLKDDPNNMDARWLLNIAYMTVAEYPQLVPKVWLIPGLDDPGPVTVKPFSDIAADLKLDVKNRGGGVIVDDFDNDGYLDIVSSAWGLDDPLHYFHNNGDGTFTDRSKESGLNSITGGINLLQTDYNNDGYLDIFVLRGAWQGQAGFGDQPNSLLKNNGDGTFSDVTVDAGLLSYHPTQTATWNDFNNDGWLDLFIGNEMLEPKYPHPCELYINNQDGSFTLVDPGVVAFVKGVTSGDYDNDGWADIFISTLSGMKILLHNKGKQGREVDFENVSEKAGFNKDKSRTFPTWFFDYDNDGWLDIYMCNYEFDKPLSNYAAKEALHPSADRAGKISLYHNNRNGTFTNVSAAMNLNQIVYAMGCNFGDIDNDGWLDMYFATGNPNYQSVIPNKLYKNLGGKNFADVTVSARVGNLQKGHGVAFADLNNNGDQDIFVDLGGAFRGDAYHSAFYLNPGQSTNNWICMQLEGTKSNRAAIGAKVTVKFTENGVQRMVYRDVNSGGSFGCSPLRREIGIGQAATIDEISIAWPASGIVQVLKNVQSNQFIKIQEGKDGFEVNSLQTLVFKKADGSIPMCAPRI